jgi:hypothetical protein
MICSVNGTTGCYMGGRCSDCYIGTGGVIREKPPRRLIVACPDETCTAAGNKDACFSCGHDTAIKTAEQARCDIPLQHSVAALEIIANPICGIANTESRQEVAKNALEAIKRYFAQTHD